VAWPAARYKTATAGGSWTPGDMNGVQDQYLRATGILQDDLDASTVAEKLGLSQTAAAAGGAKVRRGKSIIPGAENINSAAYTFAPTPDRVQGIVLPTDGLIVVAFKALWNHAAYGTQGRAAIFIGANQLKVAASPGFGGAPVVQEAEITDNADPGEWQGLVTASVGLRGESGNQSLTSDVTTGQVVAIGGPFASHGGVTHIFAAAGTYDVGIKFKNAAGSLNVTERKLWVWTMGF
jgi:hypothetical protein